MATRLQVEEPMPAVLKSNGISMAGGNISVDTPSLLVLYDQGQEQLVRTIADVLGQPWELAESLKGAEEASDDTVVGLANTKLGIVQPGVSDRRIAISTHCLDERSIEERPTEDAYLADACDYEYLYTQKPFFRRDLARFLSFVLGQIKPHEDLKKKARTTLISTTFPDVRAALPNLDILSVGADAVEIRVDLLKETLPDGSHSAVPSLKYVGEQIMLLRQRTELPIIFTTRCTRENGRFPMDEPELFYKYLHRAIQWGCEYIDVELWLPEDIRRRLSEQKSSSRIISAFHDFSGKFKWTSPEAQQLFRDGAVYGDVVKMIALVETMQENYQLEYFRSTIQSAFSHPPLSGLNMGPTGQLSRTLNKVFTPITHPLLPMIAAPGQLSAAEINSALHSMGQMPKLDMYGIGSVRSTGQAMFFEKCFNELSLPHQLLCVERSSRGSIESYIDQPNFGGAYINPPLAVSAAYLPSLSDAAASIGQVDTVVVRSAASGHALVGENATWKGIRATLCRDFVPSAYQGRVALLLASAESQAAAAIFALMSLNIGPIYSIGFKAHGALAADVIPFRGIEDMKRVDQPFVIISALPPEKCLSVTPLLKHYGSGGRTTPSNRPGRVFVDLTNGPRKGDPLAVAASLGWTAYGTADVNAWTAVETLRLLVGQNVPYDFVRLASGRSLY